MFYPEINLMRELASTVYSLSSQIILSNFNKVVAEEKDVETGDLVTAVDLEIENKIKQLIKTYFPDHNFWGEETGGEINEGYTWILDPLDGTNNFGIGLPLAGTALTLLHQNQPIFAFISYPFADKWYFAVKNHGAYINGNFTKPKVFTNQQTGKVSGLFGYALTKDKDKYLNWLSARSQIQLTCKRVFETWSPIIDFYLLFESKIDTIIAYENELFDLIGGALIASELGFNLLTFEGDKYTPKQELELLVLMVITSNSNLPAEIKNALGRL